MASFATPQRRPRTRTNRVATPLPVENAPRFSAPRPDAAPPVTERPTGGSLNLIPLYATEAPRAEAAAEDARGIVPEQV
jgi:hypothetical protein